VIETHFSLSGKTIMRISKLTLLTALRKKSKRFKKSNVLSSSQDYNKTIQNQS